MSQYQRREPDRDPDRAFCQGNAHDPDSPLLVKLTAIIAELPMRCVITKSEVEFCLPSYDMEAVVGGQKLRVFSGAMEIKVVLDIKDLASRNLEEILMMVNREYKEIMDHAK